jgi:squalene-associated FAD-dependent desaturase
MTRPPAPHVVIVGGGLAGLAAAAALVGHGLKLTILESRPRLGGRASSFPDPATGELVDNCQHVSMTCCTNLADFCARVGTTDLLRPEPEVVFLDEQGRYSRLAAGWLPAPLHLSGSFLRAKYLTFSEKLRVGYGLARLARARSFPADEPFESWLLRHGQTPRTLARFWATVLVSALNERLDKIDTGHARKVFVDGFLRNKRGFQMEIPLVPLGELYGGRLQGFLDRHNVDVRLKTGVRSVDHDPELGLTGVTLRTGEKVPADFVVLSAPYDRIPDLLGESLRPLIPQLDRLAEFPSSPITGVHLWFDRPVCPVPHVAVVDRLVQWVFNHTALQRRTGAADGTGQYLQIVISASYDLQPLDNRAILDAVLADLRSIWPAAAEATLLRSRVVTEHGATFSVRPGIDSIRPTQRTPIDGLLLAGDWTSTGWPATMEGAVRSGYLAAECLLSDLGRPRPLLRPDLPSSPLSRLLLPDISPLQPSP